ncbi:cell division ATP-binding protein FtsE [Ignavibacteria bacterium]|jgi:cell division transport system ATP-binding protein|nr:ATP-binding cassette domain-containing protein [Bacteroidota bacterium]MCZ2133718.1 ATP-binding cassette domain-containing protein [Bacteroidota bacterium]
MRFELRSVSVHFDNMPALNNISCSLTNPSATIITGPSGAGKTTLLRLLYADILPTKGSVFINGQNSAVISVKQKRSLLRNMGVIFQDSTLIEICTAVENIQYPLIINKVAAGERNKQSLSVLSSLGISHLRDKFPKQLSGGEKHLVALARAIVHKPQIVIADEPTGNLDEKTSIAVASTLKSLSDEGTTIILSTHSTELLSYFTYAEKLYLSDGKIVHHSVGSGRSLLL